MAKKLWQEGWIAILACVGMIACAGLFLGWSVVAGQHGVEMPLVIKGCFIVMVVVLHLVHTVDILQHFVDFGNLVKSKIRKINKPASNVGSKK